MILAIAGSLLLAACTAPSENVMENKDVMVKAPDTMMEKEIMVQDDSTMMEKPADTMMEKDDSTMMEKDVMMTKGASYEVFTQSAYDSAVADGKTIVLFFYADWCPNCKSEDSVYERVSSEAPANLAIFRVNYRDSETDSVEEGLARTYGVSSQHTKVIIRDNKVVLKTPATWNDATAREELAALA